MERTGKEDMTDFSPDESAEAKILLGFGGLLRLPAKNRDPADLIPLRYETHEVVAAFRDHCNLGNLALPKERWKEFCRETRETANQWIAVNGLERHVQIEFCSSPDLEYGDIRVLRVVITAKEPCALAVPALSDSWWEKMKGTAKRLTAM